jgi:hypothetical protein
MALRRRKSSGQTEASGADPSGGGEETTATAVEAPEPPPAEKRAKRAKAPKPPKAERRRTARPGSSLFDLSDAMPNREEMEREAAAELHAALGPSYERLKAEVPDAGSPDEAQQRIESRLGPSVPDVDAGIPSHPLYSGDALVYYQLRRHYGQTAREGSFRRSWYPLQPQ